MLNKDYKEMLQCLVDEDVKFLIMGAYALAAHGYPRATMDIDVWVSHHQKMRWPCYALCADLALLCTD